MNRAGAVLVEVCLSAIFLILLLPHIPQFAQWAYDYPDQTLAIDNQINRGLIALDIEHQAIIREIALHQAERKHLERVKAGMRECAGDYDWNCVDGDGRIVGNAVPKAKPYHPKVGIRCGGSVTADCYDEANLFHAKH